MKLEVSENLTTALLRKYMHTQVPCFYLQITYLCCTDMHSFTYTLTYLQMDVHTYIHKLYTYRRNTFFQHSRVLGKVNRDTINMDCTIDIIVWTYWRSDGRSVKICVFVRCTDT